MIFNFPKRIMIFLIKSNIYLFLFFFQQQSYADSDAKLSVGGTVNFNYQAYKNYRNDPNITFKPVFFYDNDKVYAEGEEVGVYLFEDDSHELRINAYYDGTQFNPKDNDYHHLKKRNWSIMAGASYMYVTPYGGFKIQTGSDILARSHGTVITTSYLAELKSGKWTWYPELGINWNNKKYNQYYYGVTEDESRLSGVSQYKPKSSFNPYLSLNSSYFINDRWNIILGVDVNYLTNQMFNSPLVDNRFDVEPFIGALYQF